MQTPRNYDFTAKILYDAGRLCQWPYFPKFRKSYLRRVLTCPFIQVLPSNLVAHFLDSIITSVNLGAATCRICPTSTCVHIDV
jgi:hypothetical protein